MKEIADYIYNELLKYNIKSKIVTSKKSKSLYVSVNHMPQIRVSDHISGRGIKGFMYNVICGDTSSMSNKTTIFLKGSKAIFYYSSKDVDKLINSFLALYKKRNLN